MRFSILFIFLFYQHLVFAQHDLKIISYNIWNGYEWGKDTLRKQQLLKWLSAQNTDIVAWQELCGYTQQRLQVDALSIGHKYALLLKESGYSVGISSNRPINLKEKLITGLHHGALHCQIEGIDFFVVHLSPISFKKRSSEVKQLIDRLQSVALINDRYIVMGDFNAHSPFDADLYKNNMLLNRYRKSVSNAGNDGNLSDGELDFSVMSAMLGFPLVDLVQRYTTGLSERGSFPGRVLGKINNESDQELLDRLERIDYILSSPGLAKKCVAGRVYNNVSNWYLSDHYPVMVKFKDID
jgi:endonuclease/exonuclease/phosphatase family metal-dependent hydrolase